MIIFSRCLFFETAAWRRASSSTWSSLKCKILSYQAHGSWWGLMGARFTSMDIVSWFSFWGSLNCTASGNRMTNARLLSWTSVHKPAWKSSQTSLWHTERAMNIVLFWRNQQRCLAGERGTILLARISYWQQDYDWHRFMFFWKFRFELATLFEGRFRVVFAPAVRAAVRRARRVLPHPEDPSWLFELAPGWL